jgi:hypothetical protein
MDVEYLLKRGDYEKLLEGDPKAVFNSLLDFLSSNDKELKHRAWEIVQDMIEKGLIKQKEDVIPLLCYHDEGTRYRVWNLVPKMVTSGLISNENVIEKLDCLLSMLRSNNHEIRALSWYSTLPPLLSLLSKDRVKPLLSYCRSVNGEWRDLVEETCREIEDR